MAAQKEASFAEGFDLFSAADLEAKEEVKPLLNHHEKELTAMGLGVPQMTRVFTRLKAMGADVDASVYTIEQAKAAILSALDRAGKGVR